MAKTIAAVIEDRIEDGRDAWRMKLKLARCSTFSDVRAAAEAAHAALTIALVALTDVDAIDYRCSEDERKAGTIDDPRQQHLVEPDDD